MKMSSIMFREYLMKCSKLPLRRPEEYQSMTNDELWRELPPKEKDFLKEVVLATDPEIEWLAIEDWLEHQFREDIKKDYIDVARMCMKQFELSEDLFISLVAISGSVRDEVLSVSAEARDNKESS